ncbi:condensation domain-containing protein, partial [Micromonospora siamensis]
SVAALAAGLESGEIGRPGPVQQRPVVDGVWELTPIQRWFFDVFTADPSHYNMSVLLELDPRVEVRLLRDVVDALVAEHDVLRCRFVRGEDGGWRASCAPVQDMSAVFDVVEIPADEQQAEWVMQEQARRAQASLRLDTGPLLRAVVFRGGSQPPRLLLTVHHLVVDGVSWRILLSDLQAGYRQVAAGEPVRLEAATSSFQYWAQRLVGHVAAGGLDAELEYWSQVSAADPRLPVDAQAANTAGAVREVSVRLDARRTDLLLRRVPAVYRTQINDVLVAALGRVLARWTGRDRLLIGMEGHGREELFDDVDVTRTVGWFTTHFPVPLHVPEQGSAAEPDWRILIRAVKSQLRRVPGHGLGYDALRWLSGPDQPGAVLRGDAQPQISFNYLGQFDTAGSATGGGLITGQRAGIGQDHSEAGERPYLLDVAGSVLNGHLDIVFAYNHHIHHPA